MFNRIYRSHSNNAWENTYIITISYFNSNELCRTFHPWCLCIKNRCLYCLSRCQAKSQFASRTTAVCGPTGHNNSNQTVLWVQFWACRIFPVVARCSVANYLNELWCVQQRCRQLALTGSNNCCLLSITRQSTTNHGSRGMTYRRSDHYNMWNIIEPHTHFLSPDDVPSCIW